MQVGRRVARNDNARVGGNHAPRLDCRDPDRPARHPQPAGVRLPAGLCRVRHAILLPPMKTGHARRAKPSRSGRATHAQRRLWVASVALPAILAVPGAVYYFSPAPSSDEIETIIKEAGFDPLVPPNRLRGPGALYVVEGGGRYTKVCAADPQLLEAKPRRSPTPGQVHDRLESGGFSIKGHLLDTINANLGATRVASIEYRVSDASINEISLSDLSEIEDSALSQERCDKTVQR